MFLGTINSGHSLDRDEILPRLDESLVISGVILESFLVQVNDICANAIEEVLRMGYYY